MTDLSEYIDALRTAIEAARGRLDDAVIESAEQVADHAQHRLTYSTDHTVVALGGATGSGKSSIFNVLAGLDLASVGVLRPTTDSTLSCTWGSDGATELLDWIGIAKRDQLSRRSVLDSSANSDRFDGLVLLDMPDHDSVVVENHLEVNRVVEFVDLFVWVLDPQKYADAAVHDRYLRPLREHQDATIVVLNQIDRLAEADRKLATDDLRRILDEAGLDRVPIYTTSVRTGEGLPVLRREITRRIDLKEAHRTRLLGDLTAAAESLSADQNDGQTPVDGEAIKNGLVETLADSAGVDHIVDAVEQSWVHRGAKATEWPLIRMALSSKSDPLAKVGTGQSVREAIDSQFDVAPSVQRAQAEVATREASETILAALPDQWRRRSRLQVESSRSVTDVVDQALASVDLGLNERPRWWSVIALLQWLTFAIVCAAIVWAGVAIVTSLTSGTAITGPSPAGIPGFVLLFVIGVVAAFALTLLVRRGRRAAARRRAERTRSDLMAAVREAVDREILASVGEESDRWERFGKAIAMVLSAR